ncbi:MAG TPA: hypothetical protein VM533_03490 [Fimbriiglobus sp.]|nr:hypothetical protein [Fimbriiglobus sp.]
MTTAILSALMALSLAPPFAVTADGTAIDWPAAGETPTGFANSFPWLGDFDGDGKPDLLIGHSRGDRKLNGPGGRLRVYRNVGEPGEPRFGVPAWFHDAVPTGRIPDG